MTLDHSTVELTPFGLYFINSKFMTFDFTIVLLDHRRKQRHKRRNRTSVNGSNGDADEDDEYKVDLGEKVDH